MAVSSGRVWTAGTASTSIFGAIDDDQNGPLPDQLQKILDGLKPMSLDYAVVDLRLDGGGNYLKAYHFARKIPDYIKDSGKLYVLTDNRTFSAAIVTLAWLRYFGGKRAVIVGEHAGDREEFWAEDPLRAAQFAAMDGIPDRLSRLGAWLPFLEPLFLAERVLQRACRQACAGCDSALEVQRLRSRAGYGAGLRAAYRGATLGRL